MQDALIDFPCKFYPAKNDNRLDAIDADDFGLIFMQKAGYDLARDAGFRRRLFLRNACKPAEALLTGS